MYVDHNSYSGRTEATHEAPCHEPIMNVSLVDSQTNLRGYVVVDSLVEGRTMGGIRMTAGVTGDEVVRLARKMTLKLALTGLPIGGAKAGIVGSLPAGEARDRCLRAFAARVAPLLRGGVYLGTDQGISYRDRSLIFEAAGYDVRAAAASPLSCSWEELWKRAEDVTGYGVCEAALVAIEHGGCSGRRLVIQGFGVVGRAVAKGLVQRGYKLVGVADQQGTVAAADGLPLDELLAATDARGTIDRRRLRRTLTLDDAADAWLGIDTDVLVLAAGGDVITARNAARVSAKVLVEGANFPCSDEAVHALSHAKVLVVPDIVANAGGASVTAAVLTGRAPNGSSPDQLTSWLFEFVAQRIRRNTSTTLERARKERINTHQAALDLAHEHVAAARHLASQNPQVA